MKKKLVIAAALCLIISLCLSNVASAVTVTNMPLTGYPNEADISGHVVVYSDEVSHDNNYVHLYSVTTGLDTSVNTTDANRLGPVINGNRVVWSEGGVGLLQYLISSPVPNGSLITGPGVLSSEPALSGDILAWSFYTGVSTDTWYMNLGVPGTTRLTTMAAGEYAGLPDVSGNYIVWHQGPALTPDVFYYDISSPVPGGTAVTSVLANQAYPRIYGNLVVYCDGATNNQDIYLYTLPGGPEVKISTDSNKGWYPDISGNYIVWVGNNNVYLYNIADGSTTQIASGSGTLSKPRIDGNHIVWLDTPIEGPATACLATIQVETTPQELPYTGR